MTKINFNSIITKSYETLILQDNLTFPLDIFNLKLNLNVKIITYEELAKTGNISFDSVLEAASNADAFRFKKGDNYIIAYNNRIPFLPRKRWSIAHEYGHIVLGHKEQSQKNEVEANFFAANLLLPRCILKELINKRDDITRDYIKIKFGISNEATEKFFSNINSNGFNYFSNEYDDIILLKSKKFISSEIKNSRKNQQIIDDEMQEKRNSWLYE